MGEAAVMIIPSEFLKWLKVFGVQTGTGGGTGPYLEVIENLADLSDALAAFQNMKLGSGGTVTLGDVDFPAGVYQAPVPCPNLFIINCSVPGNVIKLPQANTALSFSTGAGPVFQILPGSQSVNLETFSSILVSKLETPSLGKAYVEDDSTIGGVWEFLAYGAKKLAADHAPVNYTASDPSIAGNLSGIDAALSSGNQDMQDTYDNSATGNIDLNAGKHILYTAIAAGLGLPVMTNAQFDAIAVPPAGLMAWSNTANRVRVNKGSPAVPDYDEVAYLSDVNQTLSSNYSEMYFNGNVTETPIVAQSTPVKVTGAYISGLLDNWAQAAGTLTWNGSDTKVFKISATITLTPNLTTDTFTLFIALNGVVVSKSQESAYFGPTVPAQKEVSIQCLLSIAPTNTLEVWVQNDTSTNNVTITSINCSAIDATGTFDAGTVDLQSAWVNGNGGINLDPTKTFGLTGPGAMTMPENTAAGFAALPVLPKASIGWDTDDDRLLANRGTQATPVIGQFAFLSDVPAGGNTSSGNTGLGFISAIGATAVVINAQLFEKIDGVTDYNVRLSFTPTDNLVALVLSTAAGSNLIQATGSGSLGVQDLGNSDIAPLEMETLAVCTVPTSNYPLLVWTSVMNTVVGSRTIPGGSSNVGDQYRFTCKGIASSINAGGEGRLGVEILPTGGGLPLLTVESATMNATNPGERWWELDVAVTVTDVNEIRLSAVGYRVRPNDVFEAIEFPIPGMGIYAIDLSIDLDLDVLYIMDVGVDRYELIASNSSITKLVAPTAPEYSSEFRSISAIPSTTRVQPVLTISNENLNKPHWLNMSFSYEE